MQKQAEEIEKFRKEKDDLQGQVWTLENENSELASKVAKSTIKVIQNNMQSCSIIVVFNYRKS